jgi:hypothetical protein
MLFDREPTRHEVGSGPPGERGKMTESLKDAGVIATLVHRFETQRLPRALALREKLDQGHPLDDWDTEFLDEVLHDAQQIKPFVDHHPECQKLYARAVHLYNEIARKALDRAKGSQAP